MLEYKSASNEIRNDVIASRPSKIRLGISVRIKEILEDCSEFVILALTVNVPTTESTCLLADWYCNVDSSSVGSPTFDQFSLERKFSLVAVSISVITFLQLMIIGIRN